MLKGKNELHKIVVGEIKVIEIRDKLCLITLLNRKGTISIRFGLSDLLNELNSTSFLKVHRSYVINEDYIDSYDITLSQVKLGKMIVPVSRTFKEDLKTVEIKKAAK